MLSYIAGVYGTHLTERARCHGNPPLALDAGHFYAAAMPLHDAIYTTPVRYRPHPDRSHHATAALGWALSIVFGALLVYFLFVENPLFQAPSHMVS